MLTPVFNITQNEKNLNISIEAPYCKVSEVEIHFEDNDFLFYSKPYYLRLNLPGRVVYSEDPNVSYDFKKREFTVIVPKAQEGETFEGLELLSILLTPRKENKSSPLIEVIEGENLDESDDDLDWNFEQVPTTKSFAELSVSGQRCGFNNAHSADVILKAEANELFEIEDLNFKSLEERKEERTQKELTLFDEDHYIADIYDDSEIQSLLKYSPDWNGILKDLEKSPDISVDDKIRFTSQEDERMINLPKKQYILAREDVKVSILGLVDILYAYAYNKRTTEGDNNVMSPWLINRVSASLSWMETFVSVHEVCVSCIRRSLIYPLHRHFELSLTVLEDVVTILKLGRKYVLKCLLEIHALFNGTDPYYILNDLYITDYCVWLQTKSFSGKKKLPSLAQRVEKVLLTKGDINLNLVDIETIAAVAWMAQITSRVDLATGEITSSNVEDLSQQFDQLSCNEPQASENSSSSDCSSCSSDTSDSDCSTINTDSSESEDSDEDTDDSSGSEDSYNDLFRRENQGERIL